MYKQDYQGVMKILAQITSSFFLLFSSFWFSLCSFCTPRGARRSLFVTQSPFMTKSEIGKHVVSTERHLRNMKNVFSSRFKQNDLAFLRIF